MIKECKYHSSILATHHGRDCAFHLWGMVFSFPSSLCVNRRGLSSPTRGRSLCCERGKFHRIRYSHLFEGQYCCFSWITALWNCSSAWLSPTCLCWMHHSVAQLRTLPLAVSALESCFWAPEARISACITLKSKSVKTISELYMRIYRCKLHRCDWHVGGFPSWWHLGAF